MTDTTNTPTPETVKRYDLECDSAPFPELQEWGMVERENGDWVSYADYRAMESRALTAVNRFHEAQVELLRLAALTTLTKGANE